MINPTQVDLASLPWLPLEDKTAFPSRPAIYFAIDSQDNVQYIGRSVNVRSRWNSHHKYSSLQALGNVRIAYLFIDTPELLSEIEIALIHHFDPPLNVTDSPSNSHSVCRSSSDAKLTGNDKRLVVYVSHEMFTQLEALAAQKDRSISNLTRNMITKYLVEKNDQPDISSKMNEQCSNED